MGVHCVPVYVYEYAICLCVLYYVQMCTSVQVCSVCLFNTAQSMAEDKKPPTLETVCACAHACVRVCVFAHVFAQMKAVVMNGVCEQSGANTDSESDRGNGPRQLNALSPSVFGNCYLRFWIIFRGFLFIIIMCSKYSGHMIT